MSVCIMEGGGKGERERGGGGGGGGGGRGRGRGRERERAKDTGNVALQQCIWLPTGTDQAIMGLFKALCLFTHKLHLLPKHKLNLAKLAVKC